MEKMIGKKHFFANVIYRIFQILQAKKRKFSIVF